jgi:hypothetical protein
LDQSPYKASSKYINMQASEVYGAISGRDGSKRSLPAVLEQLTLKVRQ